MQDPQNEPTPTPLPPEKKPYQTPEVATHGTIDDLTQFVPTPNPTSGILT